MLPAMLLTMMHYSLFRALFGARGAVSILRPHVTHRLRNAVTPAMCSGIRAKYLPMTAGRRAGLCKVRVKFCKELGGYADRAADPAAVCGRRGACKAAPAGGAANRRLPSAIVCRLAVCCAAAAKEKARAPGVRALPTGGASEPDQLHRAQFAAVDDFIGHFHHIIDGQRRERLP